MKKASLFSLGVLLGALVLGLVPKEALAQEVVTNNPSATGAASAELLETASRVIPSSGFDYTVAVFYVIPIDIEFEEEVLNRLIEGTKDVQAWYKCASGGVTWELEFPEVVRVYFGERTRQEYVDGGYYGPILSEMRSKGLPAFTPGYVTALWSRGAGFWAGANPWCNGECGVAMIGIEAFPEFNKPEWSGGTCPPGEGGLAWPCTPLGAFAHELGHALASLPHPYDVPETRDVAFHSIMQTHWHYPTFAPEADRPWGFLPVEREALRASPFLKEGIEVVQTHTCDVLDQPIVSGYVINNGNAFTSSNTVILNNTVTEGTPTQYMASESASFAGAEWQPYSSAPAFALSSSYGLKTVYFMVKNVFGESESTSDTIDLIAPNAGYLNVTISPQEVLDAGAQWRVDGGAWQSSGATLSCIPVGLHTVEFSGISGWTPPQNHSVNISEGQTTSLSGTYVLQTGSLIVSITPPAALEAGAHWRLDGGAWQNSGAAVGGIPIGQHIIEFVDIPGWTKPGNQTVAVTNGQTLQTSGAYTSSIGADFSATPTSGKAPLKVVFADRSSGTVTAWLWDFGDGRTSTKKNPVNTYRRPGSYTVSLTVRGPAGSSTTTRTTCINAFAVPRASFTAAPGRGAAPLKVHFADSSQGSISAWAWDFGDMQTSNERSPVHIYTVPGAYTAKLTVTGPLGSSTKIKKVSVSKRR